MSGKVSKELAIISIRNGVQLSIEKDRLEGIENIIEKRKFINVDGRLINRADMVGIFKPEDMEAVTRRANGQWQKDGKWYNKGDRVCPNCKNIVPHGKQCGFC